MHSEIPLLQSAGQIVTFILFAHNSLVKIPTYCQPLLALPLRVIWARNIQEVSWNVHLLSTIGILILISIPDSLSTPVWCAPTKQSKPRKQNGPFRDTVSACMKHYLGYPDPKSGKDRTEAWVCTLCYFKYRLSVICSSIASRFQTGCSCNILCLLS